MERQQALPISTRVRIVSSSITNRLVDRVWSRPFVVRDVRSISRNWYERSRRRNRYFFNYAAVDGVLVCERNPDHVVGFGLARSSNGRVNSQQMKW